MSELKDTSTGHPMSLREPSIKECDALLARLKPAAF
jgi:hypothetical protein